MRPKECLNDVFDGDILLPLPSHGDNYKITFWPKDDRNCANAFGCLDAFRCLMICFGHTSFKWAQLRFQQKIYTEVDKDQSMIKH